MASRSILSCFRQGLQKQSILVSLSKLNINKYSTKGAYVAIKVIKIKYEI